MKELTPEQRMVADIFAKNFGGGRPRPLVLYGLGRNTEGILRLYPEIELAGVMGPDADGPAWNGKRLLSHEDAAALGADIVIVARDAVVPLIYRRIAGLEQQGVQIFRLDGTKPGADARRWHGEELPCWQLTREEVMRRIDCAEYVSFDLFDTLLGRRFLYPEDLYAEVERRFPKRAWPEGAYAQARREAERNLGLAAGIGSIYQRVGRKLSMAPAAAPELMELEWKLERQNIYLRPDMSGLFRLAEERAKHTALLSDMFWPADRLRNLLAEKGLRTNAPIFVSCEAGCSKEDGGLYSVYLERTGAAPENCLHIGDNRYSDIEAAQRAGLPACQVFSGYQMLEASAAQNLLDCTRTIQDRNTIGKWTAERCASPFALHKGRISVETPHELGHDFLGPLADFWLDWLQKELRNKKLDRMLFPSRDGFLLYRLYKMMRAADPGLPPPVYFKASRRAVTVTSLRTEEDVRQAAARVFHGSTQAFFRSRFGVEYGDQSMWDGESQRAKELLSSAMELILNHAAEERDCYLAYLNRLGLPGEGGSGFFDFVAGGTVQHFYEKLTGNQTTGFYFATSNLPNQFYKPGDIAAPFGNITSFGSSGPLAEHYVMLENVLTDPDTALVRISRAGQPVFAGGKNDSWPVMEQVQQGIFDYAAERLRRGELPAGKEAALGIFGLLFDGSVIAAPQLKKWFVYEDDYDGAKTEPCWPEPLE